MTRKSTNRDPSNVTLSEAMKLVEKSESTIRNWCKNKAVQAKLDANGYWLIDRNSLLAHAAIGANSKRTSKPSEPQVSPTRGTPEPSDQRLIDTLREALDRERRTNDDLREQVKRLESELFGAVAEMKAFLNREDSNMLSRFTRKILK